MSAPTLLTVPALLAALRRGPATLDALAARLGGPDREALTCAVEEAVEAGLVHDSSVDCGPDGLCSTSAPTVLRLTAEGARAAR